MAVSKKQAEWKALSHVRWTIKGWAFVSNDVLPKYLAKGEQAVSALPEAFKAAGEALIQPLRDAIQRRA